MSFSFYCDFLLLVVICLTGIVHSLHKALNEFVRGSLYVKKYVSVKLIF